MKLLGKTHPNQFPSANPEGPEVGPGCGSYPGTLLGMFQARAPTLGCLKPVDRLLQLQRDGCGPGTGAPLFLRQQGPQSRCPKWLV